MDSSGYFGKFYRKIQITKKITIDDFMNVIKRENKLAAIMRCIKDIDHDNNGYVTN